jgi:hypothetical protein
MRFDCTAAPLSAMSNKFDLFDKGIHVGGNRIFLTCVGVEVAIGATVFAKGDVEVDRGIGHVRLIIRASRASNKRRYQYILFFFKGLKSTDKEPK